MAFVDVGQKLAIGRGLDVIQTTLAIVFVNGNARTKALAGPLLFEKVEVHGCENFGLAGRLGRLGRLGDATRDKLALPASCDALPHFNVDGLCGTVVNFD